jgi:hypothetical protein
MYFLTFNSALLLDANASTSQHKDNKDDYYCDESAHTATTLFSLSSDDEESFTYSAPTQPCNSSQQEESQEIISIDSPRTSRWAQQSCHQSNAHPPSRCNKGRWEHQATHDVNASDRTVKAKACRWAHESTNSRTMPIMVPPSRQ